MPEVISILIPGFIFLLSNFFFLTLLDNYPNLIMMCPSQQCPSLCFSSETLHTFNPGISIRINIAVDSLRCPDSLIFVLRDEGEKNMFTVGQVTCLTTKEDMSQKDHGVYGSPEGLQVYKLKLSGER